MVGQIASGRGAQLIESGWGFYPAREKDRVIVREALRDLAAHFGLETVEQLDGALTTIYGKDPSGEQSKLAEVSPPMMQ